MFAAWLLLFFKDVKWYHKVHNKIQEYEKLVLLGNEFSFWLIIFYFNRKKKCIKRSLKQNNFYHIATSHTQIWKSWITLFCLNHTLTANKENGYLIHCWIPFRERQKSLATFDETKHLESFINRECKFCMCSYLEVGTVGYKGTFFVFLTNPIYKWVSHEKNTIRHSPKHNQHLHTLF